MSMETRQDDNDDGSDIFWPGYVDATTNLILNLLFLLTILIVAVFMFALEMGRMSKVEVENPPVVATKPAEEVRSKATTDFSKENIALKLEIQRLNKMLAHQVPKKMKRGALKKKIEATLSEEKPLKALDKVQASDFDVVVVFRDEAVELTPVEHDQLLETLRPVVESGKANIYVEVPAGFSEAKRMGFYRAMAVRNLLIEMKVPKGNINVSVVEGKKDANASRVMLK